MMFVGIDDTDVAGSKGTNQLAKAIVRELPDGWRCLRIVRHQLLFDARIPYTSKNGSASIALQCGSLGAGLPTSPKPGSLGAGLPTSPKPATEGLHVERETCGPRCAGSGDPRTALRPECVGSGDPRTALLDHCRRMMRAWFVPGSDPGLCAAARVPQSVVDFGERCRREIVTQHDARRVADEAGIPLEGLGGTNGGIIGALAAIGLAATGNDGRIVQLGHDGDDLSGVVPVQELRARKVDVRVAESGAIVERGRVDVGKKLRPNLRSGRATLFVESTTEGVADFTALKLP